MAYLFNADHSDFDGWYGEPCKDALLKALFSCDKNNKVVTQVAVGDIMLHRLCEEYRKVERKKKIFGEASVSFTTGVNMDLYKTIFSDYLDSFSFNWHTTDNDSLYLNMANHNTYAIYLPTLPKKIAQCTHKILSNFPAYYGAIKVDLGNPVHIATFPNMLINNSFVKHGSIYIEKDREDIPCIFLSDEEEIKSRTKCLYEEDFYRNMPPAAVLKSLSKRGAVTRNKVSEKKIDSHYQNLARSLYAMTTEDPNGPEFVFDVPNAFESVEIDKDKLYKYALNIDHPVGGPKAKNFKKVLGLISDDWEYLKSEIENGIAKAPLYKTYVSNFGIQYYALLPVTGKNGNTALVLTAWIIKENGNAFLTSVYIANKKERERYGDK